MHQNNGTTYPSYINYSLKRRYFLAGLLYSNTNHQLLKKNLCNQSSHYDRSNDVSNEVICQQPTQHSTSHSRNTLTTSSVSKQIQKPYCDQCGNYHTRQQVCPALGAECRKCGKRNHFAKVCRTRGTQLMNNYSIQKEKPDTDDLFIGTPGQSRNVKDWSVTILMNQQKITFKIDTSAQCNVIPQWLFYLVCKDPSQSSS